MHRFTVDLQHEPFLGTRPLLLHQCAPETAPWREPLVSEHSDDRSIARVHGTLCFRKALGDMPALSAQARTPSSTVYFVWCCVGRPSLHTTGIKQTIIRHNVGLLDVQRIQILLCPRERQSFISLYWTISVIDEGNLHELCDH